MIEVSVLVQVVVVYDFVADVADDDDDVVVVVGVILMKCVLGIMRM